MAITYNKKTGEIITSSSIPFDSVVTEMITKDGLGYDNDIEQISPDDYYYDIENKKIIKKPDTSKPYHSFNYETKELETNQELLIQSVIETRNKLLQGTDWTQLDDIPKETKIKWKGYRQQLRDITEQEGFPNDVKFPEPPK
jgi:hypothetical protein